MTDNVKRRAVAQEWVFALRSFPRFNNHRRWGQMVADDLAVNDFSLTSGKTWISPDTGGRYPIEWTIRVFPLGLELVLSTRLPQQELTARTGPTYWEGAIECSGTRKSRPVKAAGYLEMTGYAGAAPLTE